jgi:VanZ family protein
MKRAITGRVRCCAEARAAPRLSRPRHADKLADVRGWIAAWLPAALWASLIFVLSSIPGTSIPHVAIPASDKIAHAFVYAILGAFCFRGARQTLTETGFRAALLATLIATLYGISDELHQLFTPQRSADWHDVVADMVGGALGAVGMLGRPWMKTWACSMMGASKN